MTRVAVLSVGAGRPRRRLPPLTLAVPACAFRIHFAEPFLVYPARPLEGRTKPFFIDSIVVIGKGFGLAHGELEVRFRAELVGVPNQVDIEGWTRKLFRIRRNQIEKAAVLDDSPV
jgi:hypothetical protein